MNKATNGKTMIGAVALLFFLTAIFCSPALAQQSKQPSGTVTISEYELAYIFNGQMGGGKLSYQDHIYDFKLGGLGIGGIGVSHIGASGEVYNLNDVSEFPGTYVQGAAGYDAADKGKGHIWLKNPHGVVMHLKCTQEGLGLTAGADGIVIKME